MFPGNGSHSGLPDAGALPHLDEETGRYVCEKVIAGISVRSWTAALLQKSKKNVLNVGFVSK